MIELQEINYEIYDFINGKIEKFKKTYGNDDDTLTMLFKDYPDNSDVRKVTVKAAVLDKLYSTRIRFVDFPFVVQNIVDKHEEIEKKLQSNERDYKLYELIAENNFTFINGDKEEENVHNAYSFATKYLSFSRPDNPDLYPIMDSYTKELLNKYCEKYKGRLPMLSANTNDYKMYCKTLDEFKNMVNTEVEKIANKDTNHNYHSFNSKEIDMFLWQYAKDLKEESKDD